ncbi:MAG TPA: hypothetical protein VMN81_05470 [Vicinamibacterales bacterium]|nr:hypothetical protein [Vicinamibacterales bacterium]
MAYVQVARIPRPGVFARVADAGLVLTVLAVPFVILAIGAPLALAIWAVLWAAAKLF